jgi:hypothetical protein
MTLSTPEAPSLSPANDLTRYKVAVVLLTAGLLIVSAFAFEMTVAFNSSNAAKLPLAQPVLVSGYVNSTGVNTMTTEMIFTQQGCANCATVRVGVDNSLGIKTTTVFPGFVVSPVKYEASLVNGTSYDARAVYTGVFGWQVGTVDIGTFTVSDHQSSRGYMSKDFTANTPDSWVRASGTITLVGNQTVANPQAGSVSWLSQTLGGIALHQNNPSDRGGAFTALVTANHYSLYVPNHDYYDLAIMWVSSSGSTGICYVATFIGLGIIPVYVELGNGDATYYYNAQCHVSNQGF